MGVFDFNVKSCKRISEDEYQKLAISNCKPAPGDVLLSKDGTMGKVQLFYGHQDLVLLSSIALLRTGSVKKAQFLYCYLRWFVDSGKLDQFSSGSVLRRLVVKDIARIPLINPGEKVINAFSKYVSNIFDLIFSNVVQISTLTDIRDRLLPKLISGDIRVDPSKFGFGPEEEKVEEV
jgi:type I restriction enzyme S subunit